MRFFIDSTTDRTENAAKVVVCNCHGLHAPQHAVAVTVVVGNGGAVVQLHV